MDRKFKIVTDVTADLNPERAEEMGIYVIPMEFFLNGKAFLNTCDEKQMSLREFYNALRSGQMSKTSQINVASYIEHFEPFAKSGYDILYIAFSSGLSGTLQSAKIAADTLMEQYPDCRIVCVDSLCASNGEGLLVCKAVKKANEGLNLSELSDWIINNRKHLCHWFTVNDLNYLKRGGRISASVAFVGSALHVKPVLHVDNDGHLINMSKAHGRKNSLSALAKEMEKTFIEGENEEIFIGHGDCFEDACVLRDMVQERFPTIKKISIDNIGPVIGSHAGPGVIALYFWGTER